MSASDDARREKDLKLVARLFDASCATDHQSFVEGFAAGQDHVMDLLRSAKKGKKR